jgi:molybdopterin converting factor small subunit
MIRLLVHYYAILREEVGKSAEELLPAKIPLEPYE